MTKNHPDDYMLVTISIDLDAKANPDNPDAQAPLPCNYRYTLPANEVSEELQDILDAIEERRLYGFVMQLGAQMAVDVDEWVEKTLADKMADAEKDD